MTKNKKITPYTVWILSLAMLLFLCACSDSVQNDSTSDTENLSETVNGYTFVINNTSQTVDSALKITVIPDNETTTYNFGFNLYSPGVMYWGSQQLTGTTSGLESSPVSGNIVRYFIPVSTGAFNFEPKIVIGSNSFSDIVASTNFEVTVN